MKLKTLDQAVNRQRLLVNLDQSQAFIAPRNPYIRLIGELLPLLRHLEISTPSLHVNINRMPPEEMASFLRGLLTLAGLLMKRLRPDASEQTESSRLFQFPLVRIVVMASLFPLGKTESCRLVIPKWEVLYSVLIEGFRKGCIT